MHIHFAKMHGLGNDIVIIDTHSQTVPIESLPIKNWGDRHFGIGFDQLLVLQPSTSADFACQIYNADGSEAEQCGNGMRCLSLYISEKKLTLKKEFTIQTKAGLIEVSLQNSNQIQVNMGLPVIHQNKNIIIENSQYNLSILSLGNPHAILQVNSLNKFPVAQLGKSISTDRRLFPQGTNVGFMEIVNRNQIILQTYERGAGLTLACGSNACAAAVAGIQRKLLNNIVSVTLPGGALEVEWQGLDHPIFMRGPATYLFEGTIFLNI